MQYLKIFFFMIIMASLLFPRDTIGDKIYKWVDEKGAVHFSDRPPDGVEKLKGPVEESDVKESSPLQKKKGSAVNVSARSPIEYATNCTFTIKGPNNFGTGFFISSKGYAVTCKHVIEGNDEYAALLNDQNEFPISIISLSDRYDLALILVGTYRKTPWLSLSYQGTLTPGERVFAIGTSVGLQATVTDGVLTGLRQKESMEEKVIQFSAPINQGNSGGPLIDKKGKVIGVVSWKYVTKKGIPVSGVGFAVPSGYLLKEYSEYLE